MYDKKEMSVKRKPQAAPMNMAGRTDCSEQELKEDLRAVRSRLQGVWAVSVPVCRVCFATDCRLYSMSACGHLHQGYEVVTGLSIRDDDSLPPYLCPECAQRLLNCIRFKSRSLQAHLVLLQAVKRHDCVTPDSITSVLGSRKTLRSNLRKTPCRTNYYDFEMHHVDQIIRKEQLRSDDFKKVNEKNREALVKDQTDKDSAMCEALYNVKVEIESDYDFAKDAGGPVVQIKVERDDSDDTWHEKQEAEWRDTTNRDQTKTGPDENVVITYDMPCDLSTYDDSDKEDSTEKAFNCQFCGNAFSSEKLLSAHTDASDEKVCTCNICTQDFSSDCDLQRHLRTHEGDKSYKCRLCKKSFKANTNLENHLRMHFGDRPFTCEVCQKTFSRKDYLNLHKRVHTGERPYNCNVCEKSYKKRGSLNAHLKVHYGDNPYSCEVCMATFPDRDKLRKHLKVHFGVKPLACGVCGKTFACASILRIHARAHSGERPFSCDICSKSFSVKSNLRNHIKIHSGEKPHKCDQCDKAFFGMNYLRKHMRVHSGVKQFACEVCGQEFTTKRNLQKHFRRKHAGP